MRFLSFGLILVLLASCGQKQSFQLVHTQSFDSGQVKLGESLVNRLSMSAGDSTAFANDIDSSLSEVISSYQQFDTEKSETAWAMVDGKWRTYHQNLQNLTSSKVSAQWAELNIELLKLTGEVRFADELDRLLYRNPIALLSKQQVESVIYTQLYDQIYINLFGASELIHRHTTGGIVKLIQQTAYPQSSEVILKCECGDTRYLDVFIRIPEWAVNPTVTHGNVKYVARPGEYCQISRKWKNGDVFVIELKN